MAALATIINNLLLINLTTPYDCQASNIVRVRLAEIVVLTYHNPKLAETFVLVSVSACRASGRELSPTCS